MKINEFQIEYGFTLLESINVSLDEKMVHASAVRAWAKKDEVPLKAAQKVWKKAYEAAAKSKNFPSDEKSQIAYTMPIFVNMYKASKEVNAMKVKTRTKYKTKTNTKRPMADVGKEDK